MSMASGKGLRNMSAFTRTQNSVMACVENALNAFILNSRGGSGNGQIPANGLLSWPEDTGLCATQLSLRRNGSSTRPKVSRPLLNSSCHWIGKTPGSPESTSELPDNEYPSTCSDNANGLDSSSGDKGDDRSSGDDNDDNSDAGL